MNVREIVEGIVEHALCIFAILITILSICLRITAIVCDAIAQYCIFLLPELEVQTIGYNSPTRRFVRRRIIPLPLELTPEETEEYHRQNPDAHARQTI